MGGLLAAGLAVGVACSDNGSNNAADTPGANQAAVTQTANSSAARTNSNTSMSVADLVKVAQPAVVRVATDQGVGSGFVIDAGGYIITNNHVVTSDGRANASTVTVTMSDGAEYQGRVVGTDPRSDLALVKVDASGELTALPLAKLDDVQIGDEVVAIGYALDLAGGEGGSFSVTSGIVSQKNRAITESEGILGAVQTDAAINHGNSGGPLLNLRGEVVGVNTSLQPDYSTGAAAQGIGYAVGSDTIEAVYKELRDKGSVDRGLLGIRGFESLRPAQARKLGLDEKTEGIYLPDGTAQIAPGSPAANAGLQVGDVILKIDGRDVHNEGDLAVAMIEQAPGAKVPMEISRAGKTQTLQVTLGDGS